MAELPASGEIQERCGIVCSSDSATHSNFRTGINLSTHETKQFIQVFHVMLNNDSERWKEGEN